MSKINMPGFRADASICETSGRYRAIAGAFNPLGKGRGVMPQAMALMKCLQGCHYADSPDYCQQHCFWQEDISGGGSGGGGTGTGGGGGGQSCAPGCGPCHADPDSPTGGYKTCVRHDCNTYDIACRTRSGSRNPATMNWGLAHAAYTI